MAKLYAQTAPPMDMNRNTEWFLYPGVWTIYVLILLLSWLLVFSVFGCTPGIAWTLVNLFHFAVGRLASKFSSFLSVQSKLYVYNFDLYRPVRAVHTGPPGYRYADRPLPGGSVKNRLSAVDFGPRRPIE
ncbi:hypothetical protein BHM03_00024364 [Ensete ventricosum]|nr:hypothetical protein BHM03_00024364 [Ensete ventricosum]